MRDGKTARVLSIVLATAGLSACGGKAEVSNVGQGGSGGGSVVKDAGAGGGSTTTTTTTTTTEPYYDAAGDGMVADAVPAPLVCTEVDHGQMMKAEGSVVGDVLTVTFSFDHYVEGSQGWDGKPTIYASQGLGMVTGVEVQGETLVVTVKSFVGSDGGQLFFDGKLAGFGGPPSYGTIDCAVSRVFEVKFVVGGAPTIAENTAAPALPLEQRPKLALTLVGADGLDARVRAAGVLEGSDVELDTTGGAVTREGDFLRWRLPAEPGLYQLEVVMRRGGAIATSALAVEVRDDGPREG